MTPARTPEEITAVLQAIRGQYQMPAGVRRWRCVLAIVRNCVAIAALVVIALAAHEFAATIFFGALIVVALLQMTYHIVTLYRVVEIDTRWVELRSPLRFLSWRVETGELQSIDVELGQKDDVLRIIEKSGRKRRLPVPRGISAPLRSLAVPQPGAAPAPRQAAI
ncbi:MAG TPA: hypothetical protein VJ853_06055 [Thermoanaerobaculia bacterium]|nr:hypothetical protein [Thermoanaerobaculia bacterium]